jgi:hypothetical protein
VCSASAVRPKNESSLTAGCDEISEDTLALASRLLYDRIELIGSQGITAILKKGEPLIEGSELQTSAVLGKGVCDVCDDLAPWNWLRMTKVDGWWHQTIGKHQVNECLCDSIGGDPGDELSP